MAKDKKSIILYTDLIHTLRKLTDVQRGQLMLTIFEYVNDLNPVVNDPIIDVVFEPIKHQLKRDLKKYEAKKKQWSDAGKASAEARKNKNKQTSTDVDERKQTSTVLTVNVNDSVNVNDNDNDNDINNICDFENFEFTEKQQKLIDSLCTTFGVSEQKQFQNYSLIVNMVRLQITNNNYEWFSSQVWFYFQYKKSTNEKIHGFKSFMGDLTDPEKGAWNSENWKKKFIEELEKKGISTTNVQPRKETGPKTYRTNKTISIKDAMK